MCMRWRRRKKNRPEHTQAVWIASKLHWKSFALARAPVQHFNPMMIIIIISYSVRSELVLVHLLISSGNYITRTLASPYPFIVRVREQPMPPSSSLYIYFLQLNFLKYIRPSLPPIANCLSPYMLRLLCRLEATLTHMLATGSHRSCTCIYHSIIFFIAHIPHTRISRSVFIFYVGSHPKRLCENDISSGRIWEWRMRKGLVWEMRTRISTQRDNNLYQ